MQTYLNKICSVSRSLNTLADRHQFVVSNFDTYLQNLPVILVKWERFIVTELKCHSARLFKIDIMATFKLMKLLILGAICA